MLRPRHTLQPPARFGLAQAFHDQILWAIGLDKPPERSCDLSDLISHQEVSSHQS
jgi:hypothetical protein